MRPEPPVATLSVDELSAALELVLAARDQRTLSEGRRSAVMILLHERAGAAHLVLTRRAETLAHHQGEVCLPGGRFEEDDGTPLVTALRETEEELGFPSDDIRVIGALDEVHTRASGFAIVPFVGVRTRVREAVPNQDEIARVFEVSVAELLRLDDALPTDPTVETLRYPIAGEDVWGATARILRGFCSHVRTATSD